MATFIPVQTTSQHVPCEHKAEIGCILSALPCCCACADKRPLAPAYPIYVDGEGMKNTGRRWQRYCWKCRDYHNKQASHESSDHSNNAQASSSSTTVTQSAPGHMPQRSSRHDNLMSQNVNIWQRTVQIPERSRHHGHPGLSQQRETVTTHNIGTTSSPQPRRPRTLDPLIEPPHSNPHSRRNRNSRPVFPLGTREDVEQDDYQSPLAGMFTRAWDRYRTAEEVRQAERALNPRARTFNPVVGGRLDQGPALTDARPRSRRPSHGFHSQFYGVTARSDQYPTLFFRGPSLADSESTAAVASSQPPPPLQANILNPSYLNPFQHNYLQAQALFASTQTQTNEDNVEQGEDPEFDGQGPNAIDLQTRPVPLSAEDMKVDISCKICNEQKIDTLTEPCNHFVMCHWCARAWMEDYVRRRNASPFAQEQHRCPLCRQKISGTRRVHLA